MIGHGIKRGNALSSAMKKHVTAVPFALCSFMHKLDKCNLSQFRA